MSATNQGPSAHPGLPDPLALELLVAVADHGSLGAAARVVGMAQPNASRSLRRLERHLGLELVVRAGSGTTLTPGGLLVVGWAREVTAASRRLVAGAAGLRTSSAPTLTIAASQTVAEHLLPTWLARLHAQAPGTSVTVRVHNSSEVAADVQSGRCGLGFVEGPRPPRGLSSAVVGDDELVLVVAPGHPWGRRRTPVTPDELAATPLVVREPGSGTRVALEEALARALAHAVEDPAAPGVSATPALQMASNGAVRVAAANAVAPAVLSRLAVADALASGALRQVPLAGLDLHRRLRAVWAGPRRLTGSAADLVTLATQAHRRERRSAR